MLRSLLVCVLAGLLSGCFQPMRLSDGHLAQPILPAAPTPASSQPMTAAPPPAHEPAEAPWTKDRFSVTVHQVPVHDLLFALARDADIDIDIHPEVDGTVTLNALEQTLPQLLERLSRQVPIRYELGPTHLRVVPDRPFLQVYDIDYVNMSRDAEGQISASGQITGTGAIEGRTGGLAAQTENSSSLTITNRSANHFWARLEANVRALLRDEDSAEADTRTTARPTDTAVMSNPEAGLLSVYASGREHDRVRAFLERMLRNARRQVLIEATLVEVQLSRDHQQGIDWAVLSGSAGFQLLHGGLYRNRLTTPNLQPPVPPSSSTGLLPAEPTANLLAAQYNSEHFRATLRLLESFGDVRVLSSPRVSVINNQTAVLKVVDNLVYFNVEAQTVINQNSTRTVFTTTPQTVSVGFIMNVTPQIGADDSVLLNVKPTIRRLIGFTEDPNPTLTEAGVLNRIPQIREREIESVLKLVSGQTAVMGGLIQDELSSQIDSLPGLSRIPLLGRLFSHRNAGNSKSELVIFLRPLVIREPHLQGDFQPYAHLLPGPDFFSTTPPTSRPAEGETP